MLGWSKQFSILLFLDSCGYEDTHSRYDCILAVDPLDVLSDEQEDALNYLYQWHREHNDWLFGSICYDYKNRLEPQLTSSHKRRHGFPLIHFFRPRIVCYIAKGSNVLTIESVEIAPEIVFDDIISSALPADVVQPTLSFQQRIGKELYLKNINTLRRHIADGDCYEVNFCNEGYCDEAVIDPLQTFIRLSDISPAPFAAYYRLMHHYMMCASPERYLHKNGSTVLSQPIKGTARRDPDRQKDEAIRQELQDSVKNRAENVMIVDLVRNDLARSCIPGTVSVNELFGIHTFPQVHQMISTVSASMPQGAPFTDSIRYSFPMGSMTGAPKIKVMRLIEEYEQTCRELFSGTVGYITPEGDFDFNVIIRSLFYNAETQYLSYQTGGAITYDSDPQEEWEEMRLKAWALERIFA